MIDAPESGENNDQSDPNLKNIGASAETTDTIPPDNKKQQSGQNRNYSKYTMRPLKAAGRAVLAVVDWTDKNNGFVTALATVVIAILTGIYVHYSRAQWKVMRDQLPELHTSAEAAESAANTAAAQLEFAERPWIDANISLSGPLSWNVNGGNITLKIIFRNTGHSPSLSTTISPLTLIGHKGNDAASYREQVCRDATRIATTIPQLGIALFPNVPFEQQETVTFTNQDIADFTKDPFGSHFPGLIVSPTVVLCIAYRPHFRSAVYHTSYIVDLYKLESAGRLTPMFKIGEDVDNAQLTLRLHILDAISAD